MGRYKIVRFYYEIGKRPEVIKSNITLKQAQKHCKDPETKKKGVYFDGYTSMSTKLKKKGK